MENDLTRSLYQVGRSRVVRAITAIIGWLHCGDHEMAL